MKFLLSRRSKSSQRNKFLIRIVLIVLIIFGFYFFQEPIKTFFYSISSPLQRSLWKIGESSSEFLHKAIGIKDNAGKINELTLKNKELLAKIALLNATEEQNKFLRESLNINIDKEFKLTLAEIIGKDISQDFILINKGSQDKIVEKMPVITQEKVLLGSISEVYENFSKAMLISNKESSLDAKIQERNVFGLVKGEGHSKILLDFIPQDKEIFVDDIVVTSNLGGIFPTGLLVGEIAKTRQDDTEPFQQAEIKSKFDLKEINFLFIITDY
jgi:rod shape-determining protein MreC